MVRTNRTACGIAIAAAVVAVFAVVANACGGDDQNAPGKRADAAADGTTPPGDGTTPGEEAAGGDAEPIDQFVPPPIDAGYAFDYADAYAAELGPSCRSDAGHNFVNSTPRSKPTGQQCLNCHKDGGAAGDMLFFAAGSVKSSADGGPVAMVEVRLKAYTTPTAMSAYTDNDGNWYITRERAADAGVGFAVRPGVRNGVITRMMGSSPAIGNCNQCHGGQISL